MSMFTWFLTLGVVASLVYVFIRRHNEPSSHSDRARQTGVKALANTIVGSSNENRRLMAKEEQIQLYKDLYFKVQNLEDYPEVLPQARELLTSLLSEALWLEKGQESGRSILSTVNYDGKALEIFLSAEHNEILSQWEQYLKRRASGQGPELFTSRQGALEFLKESAPAKFVDGAWLAHIHRITTPFALRGITKNAWQVLSEEFGDGELDKNHVYAYRQLLQDNGINLPDGDNIDFLHSRHGMNNVGVWKAAIGQLLISLFPNDFLPEILGFNMHYEQLTMQTLKATRELPLFGISAYYFVLHVSIDNADSGHAAMALRTVTEYMDLIGKTEGEAASQSTWKRIQAGYILSKALGDSEPKISSSRPWLPVPRKKLTDQEARVKDIFRMKAAVSQKIHCPSNLRIGEHKLVDWLSPDAWNNQQMQSEFIDSLANTSPWVRRGNSEGSHLIRELSWKGKMFGAFTHSEVEDVKKWIDSLEVVRFGTEQRYWQHVGRSENEMENFSVENHDVAADHPVFLPHYLQPMLRLRTGEEKLPEAADGIFTPREPLKGSAMHSKTLFALWFAHISLLENSISTPYRTSTSLGSHIVRLLRAESGFMPETSGIAGMDEQLLAIRSPSLVDLGVQMARRQQLPEPTCLKDVLAGGDSEPPEAKDFAYSMLSWAQYPVRNAGLLLGLSRAFLDFEVWVAQDSQLLDEGGREALRSIVMRKAECLELCFEEIKREEVRRAGFAAGYEIGRSKIEEAFRVEY